METLRKEHNVQPKRTYRRDGDDLKKWMSISHNETLSIESDDPADIFATNSTCVLTPQQWSGPYWVQGELVRSHIAEDQPGIPMRMLMEFVDAHTCQPIPWLMVDIWMCNSTGKYSGVSPGENAGVNTTWLRGVQVTQADGTAQFDTIFPGYYEDRTNHIHVMTHSNSTVFRNGTYAGGKVQHIGQLYFDQDLIETIEATFPYNMNTANVTRNSIDLLTPTAASKDYDPFLKYAYVGDNLEDGLLTWISIAIDTSADYTNGSIPAAIWGQDGGRDSGLSIEFPSITVVPTGTEEPPRGSTETP
ncbi:aromatic compound dioxygenase [Neofusicoccum parvum]|nr:aromatic compound dioxygenase [Neofusicoccum parvum]